jgi:hypothetical protein
MACRSRGSPGGGGAVEKDVKEEEVEAFCRHEGGGRMCQEKRTRKKNEKKIGRGRKYRSMKATGGLLQAPRG